MVLSFYHLVVLHCINVTHFLYLLNEEHLGSLQVLSIRNNAAMNIVNKFPYNMIEHPLSICPKVLLMDLEVG